MLATDRRRQKQFTEALKLIKRLQTQMTEFERQQGPAKGPADRRRQAMISEMLKADHRRSAEMRELRTEQIISKPDTQLIQTLTAGEAVHYNTGTRTSKAMIDQGVTAALAACDANRKGDDSHTSGTGGRRTERIARECTYQDFMKCKPLYSNAPEGVEESDKIERYVGGLPNMIHGNIVASKPKTMQEAVEMATELMDKKVSTIAERQAENKRKFENTSRNNQNQQQPETREQTLARAYNCRTGEKNHNEGSKNPYARRCIYHHTVRVLQNATNATKLAILLVTVGVQEMPTMLTIRGALGINPDSNIMTGTFLLNNRYASILFDTGADRSFVFTGF
ncbi:hypothetical protein Tco_0833086 [Tanacetum coccineum]